VTVTPGTEGGGKGGAARARKFAGVLLKAAVSLFMLWWVLRSVDGEALLHTVAGISPVYVVAALLLTLLQTLVLAWRWHRVVVLLGGRLPFRRATSLTFLGLFANQALPTSVGGDLVRAWGLHRLGTATGLSVSSVIVERGTGLVVLGLLVSTCIPSLWGRLSEGAVAPALLAIGPCLLVGIVVFAALGTRPLAWIPDTLRRLVNASAWALRRLAVCPTALAEVAVLGALASLIGILGAYALGAGLGIPLGFAAYVSLVGGSVLFSILPISIGGWGVREAAMLVLFGAVGVAPEEALALSLLFGFLPLAVALPAGVGWQRFAAMRREDPPLANFGEAEVKEEAPGSG
jgi:uncharacterized membrane protein YbhN (UPF0104 family)